ncbi:MAG: CBS domain-containing protein [Nitrospirae bacterium]|nr:CBS domain-containing protein [Nitrospirota bacterium]
MLTAKDIMTRNVIAVTPDTTVERLAKLLTEHKISGMPVLDEKGKLVGIVTENDLISRNKRLHIPTVVTFFDAIIFLENPKKFEEEIKKMIGTKVGDICTKKVITLKEETPLIEIATIMSEKKIHLLPVMRGDELVGIVGKVDLVKALAEGVV